RAGDPPRPLRPGERPPDRLATAKPLPAAGVPRQVEPDPPVLPAGPDHPAERLRHAAHLPRPGHGTGRDKDPRAPGDPREHLKRRVAPVARGGPGLQVVDSLRVLTTRLGPLPPAIRDRLAGIQDERALQALVDRAALCASLADFRSHLPG